MPTTTRQRRHTRTRQAILEAALAIIREEGLAALNMRGLARRTDYSAAALYEYFGSKDEIVAAVRRQGYDLLTAEMAQADPALPTPDYLLALGRGYIRFALRDRDHFLLMFTVAPPPAPESLAAETMAQGAASYQLLFGAVQRGLAEGVFRPRAGCGLLEMAYGAWAVVHGLAMLRATSLAGFPIDFEAADREALETFVRGLMSSEVTTKTPRHQEPTGSVPEGPKDLV